MLRADRTTTPPASATAAVTEEDYLRRWNGSWRDTAFGRLRHAETCTRSRHHDCGDAA